MNVPSRPSSASASASASAFSASATTAHQNSHFEEVNTNPASALQAVHAALSSSASVRTMTRAVQIRKRMWLGGFVDLEDGLALKKAGIKYVLNCAHSTGQVAALKEKGHIADYLELNARDEQGYPLLQRHWEEVNTFLRKCATSPGSILIHCQMGINRSATVVVAHLVFNEGMSLIEAINLVAAQRGSILTNPSFREELVRFCMNFKKPICAPPAVKAAPAVKATPASARTRARQEQQVSATRAAITPPPTWLAEDHTGVAPMDLDD